MCRVLMENHAGGASDKSVVNGLVAQMQGFMKRGRPAAEADSALRDACRELVVAWDSGGDYVAACIPVIIRIRTILEGGQ